MNKTFKTIWNEARRCYIVANEAQKSHGKPSKSAVALAVAATALFSTVASAAYIETGFKAQNAMQVGQAVQSWQTDEYKKDWGLEAMHAAKAYALGFHGQGVRVAVMDSGALLQKHAELAGDRFSSTHVTGQYGSTGNRYPQAISDENPGQPYEKGEAFDVTGDWMQGVNDSHGTHVTGTVGANRDGSEFHGVSWGSDIVVGNTGATDSNNYGPYQDYDYFYAGWKALADNLVDANGAERGGVINNSWGTNIRKEVPEGGTTGLDGYNTNTHFTADTTAQTEYEYFYFKQKYANDDNTTSDRSFVDAAWDAVKGTKVVQIFTTGNRDSANPFYRPLYPYFNPEAEKQWIAVAGLKKGEKEGTYELVRNFNEAGNGKWWTVTAPGNGIYSSTVDDTTGEAGYASWGGTSMAAPHVAGAMGVLMSRYEDMDATQVRDVMFTTANHKNEDGTNYAYWTAEEGQVDSRYGWGTPDLDKGMYGPGQFLGHFEYNQAKTDLDVWSNDITNVALDQRYEEDMKWMEDTENGTNLSADYVLGDDFIVDDGNADKTDHIISKADAEEWRKEYYKLRADEIQKKIDGGLYKGSLTKDGQGTLIMTGNNSYKGATTVKGGTLLAFAESIGEDNKVTVNAGGTFGVLSSYNDNFTMKGTLKSDGSQDGKLEITLDQGGKLFVDAGSNVSVKSIAGLDAGDVTVGLASAGSETLAQAYKDKTAFSGSITSEGGEFTADIANGVAVDGTTTSAFFGVDASKTEASEDGKTLSVGVTANGKEFADFATTSNGLAIANALENGPANEFMGSVLSMDEANVKATYEALSDDMYATARNAFAVNSLTVSRTVIEQARSYGEGRAAEFANGQGRVWATASGQWMNADGNTGSMDVDFGAGFVGGEWIVTENTKVGAYFGYGTTKYDGNVGKIDGSDLHYGIYGMSDFGPTSVTYGFGYTTEDRDSQRTFMGTANAHSEDATAMQAFAEVAYTGLNIGTVNVAPYLGVNVMRIETDGFTEMGLAHQFKVDDVKDDIQVANIGARVTVPFSMGKMPVALKADVGYSRFFGDTESISKIQLGQGGAYAAIEGKELEGQANVGLGINAQLGKAATVGISYTGAFGSDTDTHGIGATLRVNF